MKRDDLNALPDDIAQLKQLVLAARESSDSKDSLIEKQKKNH